MAITGQDIVDRVSRLLNDEGSTKRWPDADLLEDINDGQVEIVRNKPTAHVIEAEVSLSPGAAQALPEDAIGVVGFRYALDAEGSIAGALRVVDRASLDGVMPDWRTAVPQAEVVREVLYSPEDKDSFETYPPADGDGKVKVAYAQAPPDLASLSDSVSLPDEYLPILVQWCLYRAFLKDSDGPSAEHANAAYQRYAQMLG